jgi:hypothetical protein
MMAGMFETTGIDTVQRNLQNLSAEVLPLLAIAIDQEDVAILEKSQPLVPFETGALRASGAVDDAVIDGAVVSGGVRYGGSGSGFERNPQEYAIPVHEDLSKHHPIGQAKFLSQAVFEETQGMAERLAEAIRLAL